MIILKQTKLLDDKEHIFRIKSIDGIPIFICHPDAAYKVKEICENLDIKIVDYEDYMNFSEIIKQDF